MKARPLPRTTKRAGPAFQEPWGAGAGSPLWRMAGFSGLLVALGALGGGPSHSTVYVNRFFEVRDHDQPVKYVFNGEHRVATVTGSLAPTSRIQRLRLHWGWNLRSLAVDVSRLPGLDGGEGEAVVAAAYRWSPEGRQWIAVSPDEPVAAGSVLWLYAPAPAALGVEGSYADPAIRSLPAGREFLGVGGLEAGPPPADGAGIGLEAWHFDPRGQAWVLPVPGMGGSESAPPQMLAPGDAVFVHHATPYEWAPPERELRVRFHHPDHLGSSGLLTDAAGRLVEETAFYPFGFPRHEHRPRTIEEPYAYTQKERDRESGLHYFGARYLVAALGRFASVDPRYVSPPQARPAESAAGATPGHYDTPQLLNLYALAAGNPLKFTDPDGRDVQWSKALQQDKAFQRAYKILENTREGQRILKALESADVKVEIGQLPGKEGGHAVGHHHGSALLEKTRVPTTVIQIDIAKSKRLRQNPEELANVLHHELRHAEIHNTPNPSGDDVSDAGFSQGEALRNKAHKALDGGYLPYNTPFTSGVRRGTGVQTGDERNADFQKEVGLLPPDYSVSGAASESGHQH